MKTNFILFLALLISFNVLSQTKIPNYELGHYFDINSQRIDGYYDVDFELKRSLKVSYVIGEDFTPGHYYDLNNKKVSGLLKYRQLSSSLKFKLNKTSKAETIRPNECLGYVIGADSFTVISDFKIPRQLVAQEVNNRAFAEVVDRVDDITFYKHTNLEYNTSTITYLYKKSGSDKYVSFPKGNSNFRETALEVFGNCTNLAKRIVAKEFKEEDITSLIKLYKYHRSYEQGGKIFFNASWDEVDNSNKATYFAKVGSIKDSLTHLKFFMIDNTPIYEGGFLSLYPHKKAGEFKWYYPNGTVRKKVDYIDDKPTLTTTYHRNGNIHYIYRLINKELIYSKVLGENGANVLDKSGNGTETVYDSITQRQIISQYIDRRLNNSYFLDKNNRKVYQYCENEAKFLSFRIHQETFNQELKYPNQSIRDFNHGVIFIRCLIEPSGLVSDMQIIKGVDSQCDSKVMSYLSSCKVAKEWKPAKVNGQKVAQELLIPINFSLVGFSRYKNNYYWDNHMHNQFLHQQMPIQLPPSPPVGFR